MNVATLTLNPALDRSMVFDTFCLGKLNRAVSCVTTVGSKGINVSRVLKLYGINAVAYGFCGGDNGKTMENMLREEGVLFDFVATSAPTRMNIKIVDKDGVDTEANESGGPIDEFELRQLLLNLEELFEGRKGEKPEYFIMGGSIPPGIPDDIYKTIGEKAKDYGIKVILDCDREALKKGITACPYIIKPNRFELEQYAGHTFETENELVSYACDLSAKFNTGIVLTMGANGAMYIGKEGVYKVNAPKVQMKGFTGAGDSFLATFIVNYHKDKNPEKALKYAAAFSAAKVELEGTALPQKDAVTKYVNEIKATKLR